MDPHGLLVDLRRPHLGHICRVGVSGVDPSADEVITLQIPDPTATPVAGKLRVPDEVQHIAVQAGLLMQFTQHRLRRFLIGVDLSAWYSPYARQERLALAALHYQHMTPVYNDS